MIFTNDKAIYIQMADRLCDEILSGVYKDDDRIPSVREYAVPLEVNTNTAVKAYEQLAREEIIYNKRGLGYFVTKGARKQILKVRKQEFMKERLPELFRQMNLLDITIEDVVEAYKKLTECQNLIIHLFIRHKCMQFIPIIWRVMQLFVLLQRLTNNKLR